MSLCVCACVCYPFLSSVYTLLYKIAFPPFVYMICVKCVSLQFSINFLFNPIWEKKIKSLCLFGCLNVLMQSVQLLRWVHAIKVWAYAIKVWANTIKVWANGIKVWAYAIKVWAKIRDQHKKILKQLMI